MQTLYFGLYLDWPATPFDQARRHILLFVGVQAAVGVKEINRLGKLGNDLVTLSISLKRLAHFLEDGVAVPAPDFFCKHQSLGSEVPVLLLGSHCRIINLDYYNMA